MRSRNIVWVTLFLLPAFFMITGCDRDDHHHHHAEMHRVNIIDRTQTARPVIATWTRADGWNVDVLYELNIANERVSLGVEIFDDHNDPIEICRGCEYQVRYWIAQGATEGIIDLSLNQDLLFHGDHVHIYALATGETEIEFLLWHGDHADAATTPVRFRVVE